jgi:hypothetical protein
MLEDSEALLRQGSVTWRDTSLSYVVEAASGAHAVSCELSDSQGGRPAIIASDLKIALTGAGEQVVYTARLRVPTEVVKADRAASRTTPWPR